MQFERMLLTIVLIVIFSLLCFVPTNAQITVQHEYLPSSAVKSDRPGARLQNRLEYTVHRTEIVAQLPTILSHRLRAVGTLPDLVWTNRIAYELIKPDADVSGTDALFADAQEFHNLDFRMTLTKFVSDTWMVTGAGAINFAVDTFDGAKFSDASFMAGVILQRAFASGWALGFGGIYSQLTGQSTILPYLYAAFDGKRYRAKIALPSSFVWYDANTRIALGVLGEIDGDDYRLVGRTADLYGSAGNIVQQNVDVNLSYSKITLGPAVNVTFGMFQLRFESGWAFNRTFEFRASEEDETLRFPPTAPSELSGREIDYGLEDSFYAKVRLRFSTR